MKVLERDLMIEKRESQISVSVGSTMKEILEEIASQESISVSRLVWRSCLDMCLKHLNDED